MAITLADAQVNTQDDIDYAVIDETRRKSWLLDQIQFDDSVTPGAAGATLTYGYTRLTTPRGGAFRAINSEYTASEAQRQRFTVDLKPLGGSFEVDRVLANLGPSRTNEVSFQLDQLTTGIRTTFQDEFVNGDTAVNADGFDGLDVALAGSSTESHGGQDPTANEVLDWTPGTINTEALAHGALDVLDEFMTLLKAPPQAILGNRQSISRVRSIARRAGYYSRERDDLGRVVERFGDAVLVDIGSKADNSGPIIPIESRDVDGDGGSSTAEITGLTDLYAVNFGLDTVHGVSVAQTPLVQTWMPDFTTSGAVKSGEAEMGPIAMVLKNSLGAAVLRNVQVQ